MGEHLPRLFQSLRQSGLLQHLSEVLLVDDGSTDETPQMLKSFAAENPACVRVVTLEKNLGRFQARWEGAKASRCEKILFLDTRLELEAGFNEALVELVPKHNSIMGVVNIDTSTSIFSLYWERSHRALFRKHFEAADRGFYLTPENYDQFLKGTTIFLCMRSDFLSSCEVFSDIEVLSDDTALMKVIVEKSPIWVDSRLAIRWWPRENARDFLVRLWERGPSFVEYHVFMRKSGPSFWVVCAGLLACLAAFAGLIVDPQRTTLILLAALCAMAASVGLFARSVREFFILMPLHLGVLVTFGAAILRGLAVNIMRVLAGQFPSLSPSNSATGK
jgi:glycosyltransferase involved in cell wall biosynthesis